MRSRDTLFARLRDNFDWPLFITACLLAVIGDINLYSATSVEPAPFTEAYIQQVYWLVGGAIAAGFLATIDYRKLERYAYLLYGMGLLSLLLVFILGREVKGSSRWIYLGSVGFQPSEFMKVWLVIALAKYLRGDTHPEGRSLKDLIAPVALAALPVVLVAVEPDLGTALIIGLIFLSVMAMVKIQRRTIFELLAIAVIGLPLFWTYGLRRYQDERIDAWLHPEKDISSYNWDPHHARIAIGAGHVTGEGFMKGTQNQFLFLHEQHSDFPFAVFAQDWGFLGCALVVMLYAFLVLWSLHIASTVKDRFGAVLAVGAGSLVFWNTFFNIGMVTGLLPIVGVTLPLFSYGGSSNLTILLGLSLLMNVSMRRGGYV